MQMGRWQDGREMSAEPLLQDGDNGAGSAGAGRVLAQVTLGHSFLGSDLFTRQAICSVRRQHTLLTHTGEATWHASLLIIASVLKVKGWEWLR